MKRRNYNRVFIFHHKTKPHDIDDPKQISEGHNSPARIKQKLLMMDEGKAVYVTIKSIQVRKNGILANGIGIWVK